MSRVGKAPIQLPAGVKVQISPNKIRVEGPKGKMEENLPNGVIVKQVGNTVTVERGEGEARLVASLHGVIRTVIANLVHGVSTGFSRELEIVGVGYRAATKGNTLSMTLGYSHPVDYVLPEGITAKVENNTKVTVSGINKVLVGMVAAKIRSFREPEPYQGKGIKYLNEKIIRKQGKAAGAK